LQTVAALTALSDHADDLIDLRLDGDQLASVAECQSDFQRMQLHDVNHFAVEDKLFGIRPRNGRL